MIRRFAIALALGATLAVAAPVRAHEGHAHKIMGTVAALDKNQLQVKTSDGQTVTIAVNDKTSIVRGTQKVDMNTLKPGERVVVDVGNGKAPMTAREVKVGAAAQKAKE